MSKVIAIIDDEPMMVDMLTTFLKLKGYQIRGAYTGQEGLALVAVEQPDLLILDLMLPDIDGYQICETLRSMPDYAAMPILIVSARTDTISMERAEQVGANGYLTKPVRFPELMTELERLLNLEMI
jgi:DNA-binding response OmpR family regulator